METIAISVPSPKECPRRISPSHSLQEPRIGGTFGIADRAASRNSVRDPLGANSTCPPAFGAAQDSANTTTTTKPTHHPPSSRRHTWKTTVARAISPPPLTPAAALTFSLPSRLLADLLGHLITTTRWTHLRFVCSEFLVAVPLADVQPALRCHTTSAFAYNERVCGVRTLPRILDPFFPSSTWLLPFMVKKGSVSR